jgi:MFS family permease
VAGRLADRWGRRRVLLGGWLVGLPAPLLVAWAPAWSWVLVANALLGVQQGLCWSMTVNMKVDAAPAGRRGLVVGLNEFAGYLGLSLAAWLTGLVAAQHGLRPAPLALGFGIALLGFLVALHVPETGAAVRDTGPGLRAVFARVSWRDERLAVASLAGLVTNLKDGALWGLLPGILAGRGFDLPAVAAVVAVYPAVWGVAQLGTGPLSDRVGRRSLVVLGLLLQGIGVALLARSFALATGLLAAAVVGLGTALAYPTLIALVADRAEPVWRASALGVFRMWRDSGYVVGALGVGLIADAAGTEAALAAVAVALLLAAGLSLRREDPNRYNEKEVSVVNHHPPVLPLVAPPIEVDIGALRSAIQAEYEVVAREPERGFHFHTGRPLDALLGYDAASGMDSLIAAHMVGSGGEVVGVDMTPAMLARAAASAAEAGLANVSFRPGFAEDLPVPDGWADVVISNGVLNLMPDKLAALAEMARVLRPGGRLQIGDIAVERPVPEDAKRDIDLWTG